MLLRLSMFVSVDDGVTVGSFSMAWTFVAGTSVAGTGSDIGMAGWTAGTAMRDGKGEMLR